MQRDSGTDDGREATGGIGPPGSISRRRLLQGAAAAGLTLGAIQLDVAAASATTRRRATRRALRPRTGWMRPQPSPPVSGLHLQFGADASNEVVVTWQTYAPVESPQVFLGTLDGGLHRTPIAATTKNYTDPKQTDEPVYVHSAQLSGLRSDREYFYVAIHEGADAETGGFRTAPQRPRAVHVHELRRPGHADADRADRAAGAGAGVQERQPRLARGRRRDRRRRADRAAVSSRQRRPLLRQPVDGAGPDLV